MVSKFDNHDPSVFWMTVKDVDKLKIALDYMKESNTATEEYGKFLNPIVQRCSDGVLVYAGLVQYFDDTNGNKGPLSKYKLSLLFDSVAKLKDCICNLETLVKELSGINDEWNIKFPSGTLRSKKEKKKYGKAFWYNKSHKLPFIRLYIEIIEISENALFRIIQNF